MQTDQYLSCVSGTNGSPARVAGVVGGLKRSTSINNWAVGSSPLTRYAVSSFGKRDDNDWRAITGGVLETGYVGVGVGDPELGVDVGVGYTIVTCGHVTWVPSLMLHAVTVGNGTFPVAVAPVSGRKRRYTTAISVPPGTFRYSVPGCGTG